MLKFSALIGAISAFACVGTASAADMAVKAPPLASAPAYDWTGFYVGGNAGYGWKDPAVSFTPNDALAAADTCGSGSCPPAASFRIGGGLGGLQAGYNWQINQNWLVGFETDFDWSGINGTGTSNFSLNTVPSNFQASERTQWFGTVRGRFGYLAASNLLLYGTGGFAYGRVNENVSLNSPLSGLNPGPPTSFACVGGGVGVGASNCFVGNSSRIATGFTIGGGAEYALWRNLSVKAEYLYVNLQGNSVNVVAQGFTPGTTPSSFTAAYSKVDFNVIRGGLNWKF